MLIISNEIVEQTLDMQTCIDVQEAAFRGLASRASVLRPRIDVYAPSQWRTVTSARSTGAPVTAFLQSYQIGYYAGLRRKREVVKSEANSASNRAPIAAQFITFSTDNGEPLAIMNDGILQHMRVGGAAAIGAKYLSRDNSNAGHDRLRRHGVFILRSHQMCARYQTRKSVQS